MFNNKQKIAAVSAIVLFLTFGFTNCSSSTAEADQKLNIETNEVKEQTVMQTILYTQEEPTILEAEAIKAREIQAEKDRQEAILESNTDKMQKAVKKLNKHLHSRYVAGGASPGYWDCSGLVRWFYLQQGIELRHSATSQSNAGKKVKSPKVGDIVAFHYGNVKWSFHVGIYVGDGKVLHAYNSYSDTVISDISDVNAENGAWASYTRIVKTN